MHHALIRTRRPRCYKRLERDRKADHRQKPHQQDHHQQDHHQEGPKQESLAKRQCLEAHRWVGAQWQADRNQGHREAERRHLSR